MPSDAIVHGHPPTRQNAPIQRTGHGLVISVKSYSQQENAKRSETKKLCRYRFLLLDTLVHERLTLTNRAFRHM